MGKNSLKILHLENNLHDTALIRSTLESGFECEIVCVTNSRDFETTIKKNAFDLILADYSLSGFKGQSTIETVRRMCPHVPLIFVSGAIGEEETIEILKQGATDCVLKHRLGRLVPCIRRATREAKERVQCKQTEAALAKSEKLHRVILSNISDAVFITDDNGAFTFVCPNVESIFGYSEEEVWNMGAISGLLGDGFVDTQKLKDSKEIANIERVIKSKTGEEKILLTNVKDVTIEEGTTLYTCRDITERKQAEEEIRFQAHLLNCVGQAVIATDLEGLITYWNQAAETIYGWQASEVIGKNILEINLPQSSKRQAEEIMEQLSRGKPWSGEFRVKRKHGSTFPALVTDKPIHDQNGNLIGVVGVSQDISERKKAEEALRESEEKWRSLVQNAPDRIMSVDRNGTLLFINKPISGIPLEQTIGKEVYKFIAAEYHETIRQNIEQVFQSGKPTSCELKDDVPGTNPSWFISRVGPVRSGGKIVAATIISTNITEQKNLEKQLFQAQKMEAIGTLAGGIAHDFNNILGAIVGYTELALHDIPVDSRPHSDLQEVLNATNRAKDLVKQILAFSRGKNEGRKPIRIQPILKDALKLLRATLPATIEIRQNIDDACGSVLADATQIHQVVINLCTNAFHAMRNGGGLLQVNLECMTVHSDLVKSNLNLREGRYLKLTVSDTGHGMDEFTACRVFEPFFTTKVLGEGTGMGLAVVHGIVESHKGAITVSSELGKGSTFTVYLPEVDAPMKQQARNITVVSGNNEYILFVEDEDALARVGKQMLERMGYQVKALTSSAEALAEFETDPDKFDLLITDQMMPTMTGLELIQRVFNIRPDMPTILITGYSENFDKEHIRQLGIREFIMKPVTAKDFSKVIRQALEQVKAGESKQ